MKRKICAGLVAIGLLFGLTACNRQIVDLTYAYDYAIIALPNGEVIEGTVYSWRDYEDGDQIQVCIDGVTYLCHSSNVTLIDN